MIATRLILLLIVVAMTGSSMVAPEISVYRVEGAILAVDADTFTVQPDGSSMNIVWRVRGIRTLQVGQRAAVAFVYGKECQCDVVISEERLPLR
jgi:hypothetical protein